MTLTVNVTTASMSTQDQKILEKELKAKLKIKTIRKKKREQRQKKLVQKGRSARTKSAGLIGECLSNQIQSALPVEVRSDGSELWKFLATQYDRKTTMQAAEFLIDLLTIEQRNKESVESWFARICECSEKTKNAGYTVPDIFISTILIYKSDPSLRMIALTFIQSRKQSYGLIKTENEYTSRDIYEALVNAHGVLKKTVGQRSSNYIEKPTEGTKKVLEVKKKQVEVTAICYNCLEK
ncbi:hypothetical protein HK096_009784 [Nowakowskiella sp. JEL0078]|nr:hypothetical protein HK096_009784 [Nowakowskiella sp. JEL0078]